MGFMSRLNEVAKNTLGNLITPQKLNDPLNNIISNPKVFNQQLFVFVDHDYDHLAFSLVKV